MVSTNLVHILKSIIVFVAVAIGFYFLGIILVALKVPILKDIGEVLSGWLCWVIGFLFGAWYYLTRSV